MRKRGARPAMGYVLLAVDAAAVMLLAAAARTKVSSIY